MVGIAVDGIVFNIHHSVIEDSVIDGTVSRSKR